MQTQIIVLLCPFLFFAYQCDLFGLDPPSLVIATSQWQIDFISQLFLPSSGDSDEAIAAFLEASGELLKELSLNNVKKVPYCLLSLLLGILIFPIQGVV